MTFGSNGLKCWRPLPRGTARRKEGPESLVLRRGTSTAWTLLLLLLPCSPSGLFEPDADLEALPEAVPGLGLVRVVQVLPAEVEPEVLDEGRVVPEVEGDLFVVAGHVARRRVEHDPHLVGEGRAVGQLDDEDVPLGVVGDGAVALAAKVGGEDCVAPALVDGHVKVGAVALPDVHHALGGGGGGRGRKAS